MAVGGDRESNVRAERKERQSQRLIRSLPGKSALRSYHVDDGGMVQDAVEHRRREHAVAGEGAISDCRRSGSK